MASIDKRVVEMKFDNAAFARGAQSTMSTLEKLKASLSNIGAAAKNVGAINIKTTASDLQPLSRGVDALVTKFSTLQIAGVTAISNIANKAVNAGTQMVKSLTIAPISGGLGEYEKKLDSIQTILANTAAAGTDLNQVSAALEELNKYSDQTIYNFGEMAKNIGTFTAAGVGLETATNSIKGIANLAALSGSSSEQASTAMYQLSQAISAGRVSLMDWNSVVNAGMGGSVFQRTLAETAVAMGKLPASALKLEGAMKNVKINGESFRNSISAEGGATWLTSDVLTTALSTFTGDLKEADLVAQGFSKSQAAALIAQAKTAKNAATIVKTGSKLMDTLRESAESGWARTWELIIGDFNEAPKVWTAINNAIGGIINNSAEARNKVLQDWRFNNGRHFFLVGLKNAWEAMLAIAKPIRDAFREIFPATTGKQLADLSEMFMKFTKGLIVGKETAQRIKSTFEGLFSILKIGVMIVSGIVKAVAAMFYTATAAGGGILSLTATVGEAIRKFHDFLKVTDLIGRIASVIAAPFVLLRPVISLVSDLLEALSKLATGDFSGFTAGVGEAFLNLGNKYVELVAKLRDGFSIFSDILGSISGVFTNFASSAQNSGNSLVAGIASRLAALTSLLSSFAGGMSSRMGAIADVFRNITEVGRNFLSGFGEGSISGVSDLLSQLRDAFDGFKVSMNFGSTFDSFNSGASTAASTGGKALLDVGEASSNVWNKFASGFSTVTSTIGPVLSGIANFFGTIIKNIAEYIKGMDSMEAVAVANTGILFLIFLKFRNLVKGSIGLFNNISGAFDQLTGTLKSMQGAVRANIIMQIAIAVSALVAALFILAKIDAGALKLALAALAILFGQVAIMLKVLTMIDPKSMVGVGVGMVALAGAMILLAQATKMFGEMDPDVLKQGAIAIGVMMAALAGMAGVLNGMKGILVAATGLTILAAAMIAMAGAIALYAAIPFPIIVQGIGAMTFALIGLAIGMNSFGKGVIQKSIAITILAGALVVLSASLAALGALPTAVIIQGIVAMSVAMQILANVANRMITALPGAAAMAVMAGAIALLAPALALMGALPLAVIGKGLLVLAGVMAIFIASMYLLSPVIVVMALFSSSLLTLGLAMLAAGAGFALFVGALGALTVIGAAGFAVLTSGIISLIALLPLMAQQVGYAIITFAKVIKDIAPKVAEAAGALIMAFINELARRMVEIAQAGLDMIIGLLEAIKSRIGTITNLAIDIVVIFIDTLRGRLPRIVQSGIDFIISFIEGLADAIRGNKERTGEAGADLAKAIVEGMISGLKALWNLLPENLRKLAEAGLKAIKNFFGINSPSTVFAGLGRNLVEGLVNGIQSLFGSLGSKLVELAKSGLEAFKRGISTIASLGMDIVRGIGSGIVNTAKELYQHAKNLGTNFLQNAKESLGKVSEIGGAIIDGIVGGISKGYEKVKQAATDLAKKLPGWVKKVLGIESPSKVFMEIGEFINLGLIEGLTGGTRDKIASAMEKTAEMLANAITKSDETIEASKNKLSKLTEAQTKNTAARKLAQKEYNNDVAALQRLTAAQSADEKARKALAAEIVRDKQRIKDLTSARNVDAAAVRAARAELARDEAKYRSLTEARQSEIDAIKAKSLEVDRGAEKLRSLTAANTANAAAIRDTKAALAEATSERARATAASEVVANQLQAERDQLNELADSYEDISGKLDEANKSLEDAIKVRDDYMRSVSEKYGDLPDIKDDTTLADYLVTLQKKVDDTNAFSAAVQKLRDMGLNDESYRELVEKGVDALPFVNQLLEGGANAVDEVNAISKNLIDASAEMGRLASTALYNAGVQTAQGLVNGLNSQLAAVQAAMAALAAAMQAKIEAELKIKSPSRVMAQLGAYAAQGLANGLKNSTPLVGGAAASIGKSAVSAMREAMSKVSQALDTNMDLVPTITPVLDLSLVQKDAMRLDSLMNVTPISVANSYSRAAEAAKMYSSNRNAELVSVDGASGSGSSLIFNQTINSPKALSHADIYRQTNNQLSVAKGALTQSAK